MYLSRNGTVWPLKVYLSRYGLAWPLDQGESVQGHSTVIVFFVWGQLSLGQTESFSTVRL